MSRKTQRPARRGTADAGVAGERRPRQLPPTPAWSTLPNRPLLGLSLAGVFVTSYLTYTGWSGDRLAYCEAGSGCDIVQASQWATFLGVPTAFWGLLSYAALTYIAARVKQASAQWQRAWVVAAVGWSVSVYLTAISVLVLQAACPYCLASLGIFTAIVTLLVWQRPEGIPRFGWPRWLLQTGAAGLVVIAAMHVQSSSNAAAGPEDPYLRGLATHLTESGAIFYGASWCPHCQEQKAMFGASQRRLPYVECSPGGPRAPSAPSCTRAGVQSYPTWVFANGSRVTSLLSLEELAIQVGYASAPRPGVN